MAENLSSSNSTATPLIRVSRKRSADPHDALILHIKKVKQSDPLVFTLFKTTNSQLDDEIRGLPVVDYQKAEPTVETQKAEMEIDDNPLGFVGDSSIGEIGDNGESSRKQKAQDDITLNGMRLVPLASAEPEDDTVFDYYRAASKHSQVAVFAAEVNSANFIHEEVFDIRFASKLEADLVHEAMDDEESEVECDDDDDSNAEDNWRNDYPDEDSYDEELYGEGSDYEVHGELNADTWRDDSFGDDFLRERFERFGVEDASFDYGGDSTDDD